MPFRDEAQRDAVCRTLLRTGSLELLWTADGPADDFVALVAGDYPGVVTAEESALLSVVWSLWTGHGVFGRRLPVRQLEPLFLGVLAELAVAHALGPSAIDAWLAELTAFEAAA